MPSESTVVGDAHAGDVHAGDVHARDVCAAEARPTPKRIAIVQSGYIPWKGYFDLIGSVDEFVLYDDAQFTRRDWRNRNRIKTADGLKWLTVPVEVRGKFDQAIKDTRISDRSWREKHWKSLYHAYSKAPFFPQFAEQIEEAYQDSSDQHLSQINHRFLTTICGILGIDTDITWSMDYTGTERKSERLLDICRQAGATEYLSGPAARAYLKETIFEEAGIDVMWMNYEGYPEYDQLHPPFEHRVTVLDLIFHAGPEAPDHMLTGSSR